MPDRSHLHRKSQSRPRCQVVQLDSEQFDELILTIKKFSRNLGKWLGAIALAASTPEDNSAEVKALTEKLKADNDALQAAIDANQPPPE